jgi:hypothetical protein
MLLLHHPLQTALASSKAMEEVAGGSSAGAMEGMGAGMGAGMAGKASPVVGPAGGSPVAPPPLPVPGGITAVPVPGALSPSDVFAGAEGPVCRRRKKGEAVPDGEDVCFVCSS